MENDLAVRSITVSSALAANTITTGYLWQAPVFDPGQLVVSNGTNYPYTAPLDTPEAWLRRRVQEICGLVAA